MHQLGRTYRIDIFAPDVMLAIFPAILALLIVGCVYFMYEVRNDSKSGVAPD